MLDWSFHQVPVFAGALSFKFMMLCDCDASVLQSTQKPELYSHMKRRHVKFSWMYNFPLFIQSSRRIEIGQSLALEPADL